MKKIFIHWKSPAVLALILALLGLLHIGSGDDPEITLGSLLEQMTDLSYLARAAAPGTRCVQFSSYDRKSRIENGEKVDWFANVDIGNYLREEQTGRGTEYVMAEAEGPGAIVRMWSANAGRRVWRIYLDDAKEPVIEARGKDLLGGKVKPWLEPFAGLRSLGYNIYFPIPFRKSVKVTVTRPDQQDLPCLMYYHVDVMLYPQGTGVRTFTMDQLKTEAAKIEQVSERLKNPATILPENTLPNKFQKSIAPGEEVTLARISGPAPSGAAIRKMAIKVSSGSDEALKDFLGRSLLTAYWDDFNQPSISSPLGDFFAASPGVNPLNSLPLKVESISGGAIFESRWVMPFKSSARLVLKNQSGNTAEVEATVSYSPWEFGRDSLYFNAAWKERDAIPTRPESDWTLIKVSGRGRYVGTELNVHNPLEYFWWGEGDEKVYVNGEEFPSIFGTGSEDYFGYAWCTQYFQFLNAYHGIGKPSKIWLVFPQMSPYLPWKAFSEMTRMEDITSQYRFHIIDNIPFDSAIDFDMEILHHREGQIDMSTETYFYAEAGAQDDRALPDLSTRTLW